MIIRFNNNSHQSGNLWLFWGAFAFLITTSISVLDGGKFKEASKPEYSMPEVIVFETAANRANIQLRPYSYPLLRFSRLKPSKKLAVLRKYSPFLAKWASSDSHVSAEERFSDAQMTKPIKYFTVEWIQNLQKNYGIHTRTTRSHNSQMLKAIPKPPEYGKHDFSDLPRPSNGTSALHAELLSEVPTIVDHPLGKSIGSNPPITIEVTPSNETLITIYFVLIPQDLAILVNLPSPNNTSGDFAILIKLTTGIRPPTYSGTITFISPVSNSTVGFDIPPSPNGAVITVDVPQGMQVPPWQGRKTKIRLVHLATTEVGSVTSYPVPGPDSTALPVSPANFHTATSDMFPKIPESKFSFGWTSSTSFVWSSTLSTTSIPHTSSGERTSKSQPTSSTMTTAAITQTHSSPTSQRTTSKDPPISSRSVTPTMPKVTSAQSFVTMFTTAASEKATSTSETSTSPTLTELQSSSHSTLSSHSVTSSEPDTYLTVISTQQLTTPSLLTPFISFTTALPTRQTTDANTESNQFSTTFQDTSPGNVQETTTAEVSTMVETTATTVMIDTSSLAATTSWTTPVSVSLNVPFTSETVLETVTMPTTIETTAVSAEISNIPTLETAPNSSTVTSPVSELHNTMASTEVLSTISKQSTPITAVPSTMSPKSETTTSSELTVDVTLSPSTIKPVISTETSTLSSTPTTEPTPTSEMVTYPVTSRRSTSSSVPEELRTTTILQIPITTIRDDTTNANFYITYNAEELDTTSMPPTLSLSSEEAPTAEATSLFITTDQEILSETIATAGLTSAPTEMSTAFSTFLTVTTTAPTATTTKMSRTTEATPVPITEEPATTLTPGTDKTLTSMLATTVTTGMSTISEKPSTMKTSSLTSAIYVTSETTSPSTADMPSTKDVTTVTPSSSRELTETMLVSTQDTPITTIVSKLTSRTARTTDVPSMVTVTTSLPKTARQTDFTATTMITQSSEVFTNPISTTTFPTMTNTTKTTEATFRTQKPTDATSSSFEEVSLHTTDMVTEIITEPTLSVSPSTVRSTSKSEASTSHTAAGCPNISTNSVPITPSFNSPTSTTQTSSQATVTTMEVAISTSKAVTEVTARPSFSTTDTPRTRIVPVTYWLRTVIEAKAEEVNESFILDMREDLRKAYEKAFFRQQQHTTFYGVIVKRRAPWQVLQIDVEMINVTAHPSMKVVEMVYYLMSKGNLIPVEPAVKAMDSLDNQEAAIIFGHVMVIKAEPYLQDPTNVPYTNNEQSVVLPAVLGSIAALLLLILIAIIIYYCICRKKLSNSTSSLTIGQRNRQRAFEEDVTSSVVTLGPGEGSKSQSGNVWTSSQPGLGSISHFVQTSPPPIPKRTKRAVSSRPLPTLPGDTDYANVTASSSTEKLVEDVPVPPKRKSLGKRTTTNAYRNTMDIDYDFDKIPKTGGIFDHLKPPVSRTTLVKNTSTSVTIHPNALPVDNGHVTTLPKSREFLSNAIEPNECIPATTQTEEFPSYPPQLERSISHPQSAPEFDAIQAEIQMNTVRQRMQEVLDEAFSFWRNRKLSPRFQRRLEPQSSYLYTPQETTLKNRKDSSVLHKQKHSLKDSMGHPRLTWTPDDTQILEENENAPHAGQVKFEPWTPSLSSGQLQHSRDFKKYAVSVSPSGTPSRRQPHSSTASMQTTSLIGPQLATNRGSKTITPVNGENEVDFVNSVRVSKDPETQFLIRAIKEELQKFRTSYANVDYAIV